MTLATWLRARGGAAHTSELYAAGFGKKAIAEAVRSGRMLRRHRSWIALPDADPAILAAISAGGRLTCVSAARHMGLWVPPSDGAVHVAVSPTAARFDASGLRVHWTRGPVPTSPRALVDPLVTVLRHVAHCQERVDALAIWESAIRKGLADPAELALVRWRSTPATELASVASGLSDSGLETHFVHLMRGHGVRVRQQVVIDGRRVDGLIGECLIVQLDGFAHHSSAVDRRRDIEADARLRLRGYTVLRFDYVQILFHPGEVADVVLMAMAQGLHRAAQPA